MKELQIVRHSINVPNTDSRSRHQSLPTFSSYSVVVDRDLYRTMQMQKMMMMIMLPVKSQFVPQASETRSPEQLIEILLLWVGLFSGPFACLQMINHKIIIIRGTGPISRVIQIVMKSVVGGQKRRIEGLSSIVVYLIEIRSRELLQIQIQFTSGLF